MNKIDKYLRAAMPTQKTDSVTVTYFLYNLTFPCGKKPQPQLAHIRFSTDRAPQDKWQHLDALLDWVFDTYGEQPEDLKFRVVC